MIQSKSDLAKAIKETLQTRQHTVISFEEIKDLYSLIEFIRPEAVVFEVHERANVKLLADLERLSANGACKLYGFTSANIQSLRELAESSGFNIFSSSSPSIESIVHEIEFGPGSRAISAVTPLFSLDRHTRRVITAHAEFELCYQEYRVLEVLIQQKDRVMSRQELLNRLGPDVTKEERVVDALIARIRKKLGDLKGCIRTVRGAGYLFSDRPVEAKLHVSQDR